MQTSDHDYYPGDLARARADRRWGVSPAWTRMQIKLFPDKDSHAAGDVVLQGGQIGLIRFAATPTSFPHVCRALAALTGSEGTPSLADDTSARSTGS